MEGTRHQGFAFFHLFSTCVTFDKQHKTWEHLKKWVHPLPEGYDPTDRKQAIAHVLDDDWSLGVIYNKN
jgi:2-oxoglutarate ferredoxin oxidoreductase subunit beta